jgi:hypothetical protein
VDKKWNELAEDVVCFDIDDNEILKKEKFPECEQLQ